MTNEDVIIIANSDVMKEILVVAKKVAYSDAAVLITGESGTGKELIAKFIHLHSRRANNKFVAINCASIPIELLENELFGHRKGAYTDAKEDYPGKIGFANGGTLFLDEITLLNYQLQSKLLRFLQDKYYEPIGTFEPIKSDVRIIAATNTEISKLVKEKKFREDLYYRLNVVPISLPPLRERKEDIQAIANYYLSFYSKKINKNIKGFTKEVMEIFLSYSWPGNVRELQNVIERAIVLSDKEWIDTDQIFLYNNSFSEEKGEIKPLKDAIINFKRKYIIEALDKNNWNQTRTARKLNIQRSYLARLIKELKIDKL